MDIIEKVKHALKDNIEAALPSNIVIDYDYPARAAIEAAGVNELVEALEKIVKGHPTLESAEDQALYDLGIAKEALERYKGN